MIDFSLTYSSTPQIRSQRAKEEGRGRNEIDDLPRPDGSAGILVG